MNKRKIILWVAVVCLLVSLLPATVFAATNGWSQNSDGTWSYYQSGSKIRSKVAWLGNAYYGFDSDGIMYTGTSFSVRASGKYCSYRAKANGTLYTNAWYQDGNEWYYYGTDAKGADGFLRLGGVWYYFDDGYMYADTVVRDDGVYYALGKSGAMISTQGWHIVDSAYVYAAAGGALAEGWKKFGSSWYYFDPYMYANTLTKIGGVMYAINNSGVCTEVKADGVYDIGTEGKIYIQGGKQSTGWKKMGGSWYYFDPYMYRNGVYTIDKVKYVFDQNGKMFTGGWLYLGDLGGCYYVYADSQGRAYTGVKTIGGTKYIFDSEGRLYTDTVVSSMLDGSCYVVNSNGVATSTGSTNGWKLIGGKYYYQSYGSLLSDTAKVIDGNLYAFDESGVMVTDRLIYTRSYGGSGGYALLGSTGAALKGWQKYGGQWVYAGSDGYLVDGRQTIGGSAYIFSDWRMKTGTFVWEGSIITTNGSGVIVSEKNMADGWTYADGTVYYHRNGAPYTGWVGDYYVYNGVMQVNTVFYDEKAACCYAVDTYGRYIKNGWYQDPYFEYYYPYYTSNYCFAKADGKLAQNEWLKLGGNWYYFSDTYMVCDIVREIDGVPCKFDENGKYLGSVTGKDGWKQVGKDWYYLHAGEPVQGIVTVDGNRYIFGYDGVMLSGGFVNYYDIYYNCDAYYYVGSNGAVHKYTGWKWLNGNWCYFDSSNRAVTGWFQDGGKIYHGEIYYDRNDKLCVGITTGYMSDGEYLHYFASSGAYQGTRGVENGWYQLGSDWLYFENGKLANGYRVIGGVGYYFEGGFMLTNGTGYDNGRYYYFGSNGVQVTKAGWLKTKLGWIYVRADGTLCNGIWKIGGTEYYFVDGIMVR